MSRVKVLFITPRSETALISCVAKQSTTQFPDNDNSPVEVVCQARRKFNFYLFHRWKHHHVMLFPLRKPVLLFLARTNCWRASRFAKISEQLWRLDATPNRREREPTVSGRREVSSYKLYCNAG